MFWTNFHHLTLHLAGAQFTNVTNPVIKSETFNDFYPSSSMLMLGR